MEVIVPTPEFPPALPFTLQLTLVSVVLDTVAVKVIWFPSTTEPDGGVTLTVMEGGGGGGGAAAPPPPQPRVHAPAVRRTRKPIRAVPKLASMLCGRGRTLCAKQAKGQRKRRSLV